MMGRPYFRLGNHVVYKWIDQYSVWYFTYNAEYHILTTDNMDEIHHTVGIRRAEGLE